MTALAGDPTAARVRWLVAGAFSPAPTGRGFHLTRSGFNEVLAACQLRLRAEVPDRLGDAGERAFDVELDSLGRFKLKGLVEAVPDLRELKSLATDLNSSDAARRPAADAALERLVSIVGEGRLSRAVQDVLLPASEAAAPAAAAASSSPASRAADAHGAAASGAIDRIFDQADVKGQAAGASSAVSSFVSAMRSGTSATPTYRTASGLARRAARLVEDALYATAADILRTKEIHHLEAAWRGLKLVMDHCPSVGDVDVTLLDTTVDGDLAAGLQNALDEDEAGWPDAMFVVDPCADIDVLRQLASLAEELHIPVVVTDGVLPTAALGKVSHSPEETAGALPAGWEALRASEEARWLSVMSNRVVLFAEGAGPAERVVHGSPVWVAAAALSASYRDTSGFGHVLGRDAAVKAPAVWQPSTGSSSGHALPTELFLSITAQSELATLGVVGLGSARNSDKVILTTWPTVRQGPDALPLPAQIFTGRIVRFAMWVRDQLPATADASEVGKVYEEAAAVFLFAGLPQGAARLQAELEESEAGAGQILVSAQVHPLFAGAPLQVTFPLPRTR